MIHSHILFNYRVKELEYIYQSLFSNSKFDQFFLSNLVSHDQPFPSSAMLALFKHRFHKIQDYKTYFFRSVNVKNKRPLIIGHSLNLEVLASLEKEIMELRRRKKEKRRKNGKHWVIIMAWAQAEPPWQI